MRKVIDESGAIHSLTRRIGVGGQGEVWLTEGRRRIVKILNSQFNADAMRRQFAFVRRLNLNDLHVARPMAVLKPPHVGYVAEFLDDMESIKALIEPPKETGLLQWHINTGGLRRRLRLLAYTGEALAGLHSRGVIYSDISHNNVFVSKPIEALEAWLIDLDNLSHESDPKRIIYTGGYGAPELIAGKSGSTTLSDAWAFAVLVWQTLTLGHPFVGDFVSDGEPELEEKAFAGLLPWVQHSTDQSNACSNGLPPDLVMARRLIELARRTFEEGLSDRTKRPSVAEWIERLHIAADLTILCQGCTGTYFVTEHQCPWCDEPRPAVELIRIERWHPDKGLVQQSMQLGQLPLTAEGLLLPRRVTEGLSGVSAREQHIKVEPIDRGFLVRTVNAQEAWVAPISKAHEQQYRIDERGRVVPTKGWMLFFEEPCQPQRVAVLGGRS